MSADDLTLAGRARDVAKYQMYGDIDNLLVALADRIETLEAERDGIRRRDEEVGTDEGWWIGGAWGDYGEAVVPLRILSYVIDGALDQKVESIDPGFALTYAEQVARADRAEAEVERLRAWQEQTIEAIRDSTEMSHAAILAVADAVLAALRGGTK